MPDPSGRQTQAQYDADVAAGKSVAAATAPSGGEGGKPGDSREITLPSGRRVLQTYSPTGDINMDGSPVYAWSSEGSYFLPKDAAGGEGAASAAATRHLSAMTSALSSFLQAQSLADARKMAASEQFAKMAQFAVPEGTTVTPGYEENGPMQALAAIRGRKQFNARPLVTQHVNPAQLAEAGQVPPEVLAMINQVKGAA
jgi:hypothetical protein